MPDWLPAEFHPFSLLHFAVVMTFLAATVAVCMFGRRWRRTRREATLRCALGWANLAIIIAYQIYWLLPGNFEWTSSLPLHICDLAGWMAALALLTDRRLCRTLVFFWGVCLTSQGFITPVLTEGPATAVFWFFFLSHGVIVGTAAFEAAAGGFSPGWRDWAAAIAVTAVYVVFVFILDLATGWNYGYVGDAKTTQPTVLDVLGTWPWRVPLMCAIGVAVFTLAMLPWEIARWLGKRTDALGAGSAGRSERNPSPRREGM